MSVFFNLVENIKYFLYNYNYKLNKERGGLYNYMENVITSIYNYAVSTISLFEINDIIDILIVAYIFYKILMFAKDSRAGQVINGILVLLILTKLSDVLKLHSLSWLFKNILTVGPIAVLVVFQPELRAGLEHIGRSKFNPLMKTAPLNENILRKNIDEIADAMYSLSKDKIGALIIIERQTKLGEIIRTGTSLNADISSQLLMNIFSPNTPLHDGAVVIRENNIKSASCFLPLTERTDLSKSLGTRHRAGIGASEISDCISIMVSEETGQVSIAMNGNLIRGIKELDFKNTLFNELYNNESISKTLSEKKGVVTNVFSSQK